MCVILIKRPGVSMPTWNVLERCFHANPDGAGLAYTTNGAVTFHKGLMDLDAVSDCLDELPDLTDKTLIIHFRWATHGGYSDAMTHPFTCATKKPLLALDGETSIAVFHNGIISDVPVKANLSDTAVYCQTRLYDIYKSDNNFYRDDFYLDKIARTTRSRFAFLTGSAYSFTGGFYECDNILFSNLRWQY